MFTPSVCTALSRMSQRSR